MRSKILQVLSLGLAIALYPTFAPADTTTTTTTSTTLNLPTEAQGKLAEMQSARRSLTSQVTGSSIPTKLRTNLEKFLAKCNDQINEGMQDEVDHQSRPARNALKHANRRLISFGFRVRSLTGRHQINDATLRKALIDAGKDLQTKVKELRDKL